MNRARIRSSHITISADVDIDEVLDEIATEILVDELQRRQGTKVDSPEENVRGLLRELVEAAHEQHPWRLPVFCCPHSLCIRVSALLKLKGNGEMAA